MVSEPFIWPPPPVVAGEPIFTTAADLLRLKQEPFSSPMAPENRSSKMLDVLEQRLEKQIALVESNQQRLQQNTSDIRDLKQAMSRIEACLQNLSATSDGLAPHGQRNFTSCSFSSFYRTENIQFGTYSNNSSLYVQSQNKKTLSLIPPFVISHNFEARIKEEFKIPKQEEKCERIEKEYKTQEITTAKRLKEPESFLKLISLVSVPEVHFAATPFATQTSDLGNMRVSLGLTPLAVVRLQVGERSSEFRTSAQSPMGSQFCYSSSFQRVSSPMSLISPFQKQRSCDIGKWVASSLPRVCFSSPTRTHISFHSSELFTWFNTLLCFDQIAKSHMSIKDGCERLVENKVGLFFVKDRIANTSHLDIHNVQECNRSTFTIPSSKMRSGHKHLLVTRLQTSQFSNLVSNLQYVTVLARDGDFIWHRWRLRTLIDPLFGDATVSSMIRCIIFAFFKGVLSIGFFFLFMNSFTQIIAVSPLHIDKGMSNVQTRKSKGSEEFCFTQTKLLSNEMTCLGYCVGNDLQLSSIGNALQLFFSTVHEAMNFGFVLVILVFSSAAYRCEWSNFLTFQGGLPTIFRLVTGGSKQNPTSNGLNKIAIVTFYLDMAWAFQAYMGPAIFFLMGVGI